MSPRTSTPNPSVHVDQEDRIEAAERPKPEANAAGPEPIPLVRGTIDIAGPDGVPIANREILLSVRSPALLAQGTVVTGAPLRNLTNAHGHTEFLLGRGLEVSVAIAGTDIRRDIRVPTDPTITTFDLLDASVGADDVFVVQRPTLEYAARRTL